MDAAVSYAADEQMRVEALRAAVSFFGAAKSGYDDHDVLMVADRFLDWLLDEDA